MKPLLANALLCQPWNLESDHWLGMFNALQSAENLSLADFFTSRDEIRIDENGIAHIQVLGVLGDMPKVEEMIGNTSYATLANEFEIARTEALAAMLYVDSPGGQAVGNTEVSQLWSGLKMPKAAHIAGMGCSAAYSLAVGSDRINAIPSALVGSIGTIMARLDVSGLWEKMGVKPDYVVSGDLKAASAPPSMNEKERASLQEIVDDLFAQFRGHVLNFRRVADDDMRGQAFVGTRAKERNLVDTTGSFSSAYGALLKRVRR
jgi:protease-4